MSQQQNTASGNFIERTFESIRMHQSKGRAMLYQFAGKPDIEVSGNRGWITGTSGEAYLDWGGYSVSLLGHRPDTVVKAVSEQLNILPISSRTFPHSQTIALHDILNQTTPKIIDKFMLLNSGSEAVEAALKLARLRTGRSKIGYLEGAYHGKTLGALSVTDSTIFKDGLKFKSGATQRLSRTNLDNTQRQIALGDLAAVILEPIQGEGGIYVLDSKFLQGIRASCYQSKTLLICDEIQCGLGRTGHFWVSDYSEIEPDILLTGKALGGGVMPVSALMATKDAFKPFDIDPIKHSSTFGGNPLASAAVIATLKTLLKEKIAHRCLIEGHKLQALLNELISNFPSLFVAQSGRGLLRGLSVKKPVVASLFLRSALQQNVMLTPCLTTPTTIRFSPPAIVRESDFNYAKSALDLAAQNTKKELELL